MALELEDIYRLNVWSFLKDFEKLRKEFIELARIAYHSTKDLTGKNPSADECEQLFSGILLKTEIFRGILAKKYLLLPDFYRSYALAFARYVLHNYWVKISC